MPTIYDVAKKARVSITTVSRVINQSGSVSEKTREIVNQAIRELGYHPNPSARSLALGRGKLAALVVPDIANPFYADMARGAQDACSTRGYHLLICSTDGDPDQEASVLQGLNDQQVDGICFVRYQRDPSLLKKVSADARLVVIGAAPEDLAVDSVGVFGTGRALRAIFKQLALDGRRRFAHIAGPPTSLVGDLRVKQYRHALEQSGLEWDESLVKFTDFSPEAGKRAAEELLALPDKPDVIFAANDMLAIEAFKAATEVGLDIPSDIALIGCDDIPFASALRPSLTSIHIPTYEMGRQAVELLFSRLDNPGAQIRNTSLEARAVIRQSTGGKET